MLRIRNFLTLAAAAVVGAAILGTPSRADAGFSLTISDGTNTVTVNDNNSPLGSDPDLDTAAGQIIFSGNIGAFNINITTGTSNAPGTVGLAQLTINNTSITSNGFTGTQTLTFTLEDTGFSLPTGNALTMESQLATTQLPSNTGVTFQSFLNANGGTLLSLNTVGAATASNPVGVTTTPFTLRSVAAVTITGTGGMQTVQFSGITAVVVPAPAGLVLALTALPCLGLGTWLRRRRAVCGAVAA